MLSRDAVTSSSAGQHKRKRCKVLLTEKSTTSSTSITSPLHTNSPTKSKKANPSPTTMPRQPLFLYKELGQVFAHSTATGYNQVFSTHSGSPNASSDVHTARRNASSSVQNEPTDVMEDGAGVSRSRSVGTHRPAVSVPTVARSSKKSKRSMAETVYVELMEDIQARRSSRMSETTSSGLVAAGGQKFHRYSATDCIAVLDTMEDLPNDFYNVGTALLGKATEFKNIFMDMREDKRQQWLEFVKETGVNNLIK